MLTIDFAILPLDRAVSPLWRPGRQVDLAAVPEMDLRYEYFWSKIEFVVDGIDFGGRVGGIPLLDFVATIRTVPDDLIRHGRAEVSFTETANSILFSLRDGIVEIVGVCGESARIGMPDLVNTVHAFVRKAVANLIAAHPSIASNAFVRTLVLVAPGDHH